MTSVTFLGSKYYYLVQVHDGTVLVHMHLALTTSFGGFQAAFLVYVFYENRHGMLCTHGGHYVISARLVADYITWSEP